MSNKKKTPNESPELQGGNVTEDVIPAQRKRGMIITSAATQNAPLIPEEAPAEAPAEEPAAQQRFIKTEGVEFVSVRAEKRKQETATEVTKYSDRLTAAPVPAAVHTGHTGKLNTYDTIHTPQENERMIGAVPQDEQLTMDGIASPQDEPTKEADPAAFGADDDVISADPTKHFDMKATRLKEIADTANDDVRRNPDQMMMEGFDEIGKKTEDELRKEAELKDELQQSRAERVKNFRFWDKPAGEKPADDAEAAAGEKFSHTKKTLTLPAFAEKFSARFADIATPFIPIKTEEYTEAGSRKIVFDAIKNARMRSLIGAAALAVFALILIITDIAAKVSAGRNEGFMQLFGGNPDGLVIFNFVFLLLGCVLLLPDLKNGVVSVLQLRPKTEALLLLLTVSTLTQTVAAFISQQKIAFDYQLLAPAMLLVCVPYMLAKVFYYDNARQVFKTVSAKSEKNYLRKVTDKKLRTRLGCAEDQNTVFAGKTRAVSGFPASAESGARGEMPASRITAALGGASLLIALITLIIRRSFMSGVSALTLCLALCLPVCSLLAAGFFLSRTNAKLSLKSSFIQSFGDAKTFSSIDTITCDASELFTAEITNCLTAKGVNEKQARFAAAAATAEAGSLLGGLFADERDLYADKVPPAKNTVYEDKMGVSSYVGGCTVLLGNHDMMLNHNVEIPEDSAVARFLKEGEKPLYLAMEGRFTALFAVKYDSPDEVRRGIRKLVDGGTALLLSTTDPNISDRAAEELLGLAEDSVRLIGSAAAKRLARAQAAVTDTVDAGVIFTDSFVSLARVALQAVKLDSLSTVTKTICLAGSAVSLLLGALLSFTGAFVNVTALTVLALQGAWIALCFISPFFNEYAMRLLRKIPPFNKAKEAPADETPALAETAAAPVTPAAPAEEAPAQEPVPERAVPEAEAAPARGDDGKAPEGDDVLQSRPGRRPPRPRKPRTRPAV